MASKNFFKDNFVLIIGLALPVLLMFGFMIASSLPNALGDPPKYDLIFTTTDSTNSSTTPVSVKLTVDKDGVLKAQYTKTPVNANNNGASYYYNAWKKIYVYEAATQKVKELPFPYPADMDKMTGTTEEVVEATKGYKLDTNLESPDGYTMSYDGYSRSGFVGELFVGGRYGSEMRLRKGSSSFPLTPLNSQSPFYYGSADFVGWATGKNQ